MDRFLFVVAVGIALILPTGMSLGLAFLCGDDVSASMHASIHIGHIAFLGLAAKEIIGESENLITVVNALRCMGLTVLAILIQATYLWVAFFFELSASGSPISIPL